MLALARRKFDPREALQLPYRLLHAGRGVANVELHDFGSRHAAGVLHIHTDRHHRPLRDPKTSRTGTSARLTAGWP